MLKRFSIRRELAAVTDKLDAAYDQLADGNRVRTVEEFHAYGQRWNVDTVALIKEANAKIERESAERAARRTARLAAGYSY